MRQRSGCGFITVILAVGIIGSFAYLVWANAGRTQVLNPIVPTESQSTQIGQSWEDVLRSGLNLDGSPVPTIAIPDQRFVVPTLVPLDVTPTLLQAINVGEGALRNPVFITGSTPTLLPPTATLLPTNLPLVTINPPTQIPRPTSPPSLDVPLIRDPRDHYLFARPIDSDRRNSGLTYYEYGTNGPKDDPYPIHSGIDIPNDVGTTVRAPAGGTVIFSTDVNSIDEKKRVFQNSPSYGTTVVIKHDFSYQGKALYTVFAHLEAPLVVEGERVEAGQPIALLGNTGHSSGPHVHFEVRLEENEYGSTYNPVLWMAPYVGHGTIAGQVVDARGNTLQDTDVTLSRGGYNVHTTTSYVVRDEGSSVNGDPAWQENFVFSDVPVGRWTVSAVLNGTRIAKVVDVYEGITTPVVLEPAITLDGGSTGDGEGGEQP